MHTPTAEILPDIDLTDIGTVSITSSKFEHVSRGHDLRLSQLTLLVQNIDRDIMSSVLDTLSGDWAVDFGIFGFAFLPDHWVEITVEERYEYGDPWIDIGNQDKDRMAPLYSDSVYGDKLRWFPIFGGWVLPMSIEYDEASHSVSFSIVPYQYIAKKYKPSNSFLRDSAVYQESYNAINGLINIMPVPVANSSLARWSAMDKHITFPSSYNALCIRGGFDHPDQLHPGGFGYHAILHAFVYVGDGQYYTMSPSSGFFIGSPNTTIGWTATGRRNNGIPYYEENDGLFDPVRYGYGSLTGAGFSLSSDGCPHRLRINESDDTDSAIVGQCFDWNNKRIYYLKYVEDGTLSHIRLYWRAWLGYSAGYDSEHELDVGFERTSTESEHLLIVLDSGALGDALPRIINLAEDDIVRFAYQPSGGGNVQTKLYHYGEIMQWHIVDRSTGQIDALVYHHEQNLWYRYSFTVTETSESMTYSERSKIYPDNSAIEMKKFVCRRVEIDGVVYWYCPYNVERAGHLAIFTEDWKLWDDINFGELVSYYYADGVEQLYPRMPLVMCNVDTSVSGDQAIWIAHDGWMYKYNYQIKNYVRVNRDSNQSIYDMMIDSARHANCAYWIMPDRSHYINPVFMGDEVRWDENDLAIEPKPNWSIWSQYYDRVVIKYGENRQLTIGNAGQSVTIDYTGIIYCTDIARWIGEYMYSIYGQYRRYMKRDIRFMWTNVFNYFEYGITWTILSLEIVDDSEKTYSTVEAIETPSQSVNIMSILPCLLGQMIWVEQDLEGPARWTFDESSLVLCGVCSDCRALGISLMNRIVDLANSAMIGNISGAALQNWIWDNMNDFRAGIQALTACMNSYCTTEDEFSDS
jgi:hypothetical protein